VRGASRSIVALVLLSALAGCAKQMPAAQTRALQNDTVETGMTRAEVEAKFGFPQRIEKVGTTTFYFYTPSWYIPSFLMSSRNPIALVNGKVVGMGQAYYAGVVAGAGATANAD
jgi:hypothetical protein